MAEENTGNQEAPQGKGSKKLLFIIIGLVFVVLVGGGVGLFFALSGSSSSKDDEAISSDEEEAEALDEGELAGAVHPLESFIVNLKERNIFLKTRIELQFIDPVLPTTIKNDTPKIRDTILRILSSKSAKEILTQEGKEALKEELTEKLNDTLGRDDIEGIYFTEFVVQ